MGTILIVDDDKLLCETLSRIFSDMGHLPVTAHTLGDGLDKARKEAFDAVFLDVRLPDGNGLEHIRAFTAMPGEPEVVIITGYSDPDGAALSIRNDAWDYLKKPASLEAVQLVLARMIAYREKKRGAQAPELKRDGIIGSGPRLSAALELLARYADTSAGVLITGETGTGKELFARALHTNSRRADGPFVVVDCAALPSTLAESLLFGHAKGSFTGAVRDEPGLIRMAHRGTLFMDEIGELSQGLQTMLLRVLQEKRWIPVGERREVASDFRLVAVTNRDLDEMAADGRFREDLLFRIGALRLHLPPLRERTGDIPDLTAHYIGRICTRQGLDPKKPEKDFLDALDAWPWPGNVREFVGVLEEAVASAGDSPVLFARHLPRDIREEAARRYAATGTRNPEEPGRSDGAPHSEPLPDWKTYRRREVNRIETRYLRELMARADGNARDAAVLSGLSLPRLYELIRKHGLG